LATFVRARRRRRLHSTRLAWGTDSRRAEGRAFVWSVAAGGRPRRARVVAAFAARMLLPAATALLGFTRGARIAPIVTRAGKVLALGARSVVIARARSLEPAGRTVLAVGFRIAGIG